MRRRASTASNRGRKTVRETVEQKRCRDILRIERADRCWNLARRKQENELIERMRQEGTDELVAVLLACAQLPGKPPPGYHQRREKCHKCDSPASYSRRFDARYCVKCKRWLDLTCGHPECEFCGQRPKTTGRIEIHKGSAEQSRC